MTALTKRQAAEEIIENMPPNQWQPLEELAKQGRYNRFCLTPRELAMVLREHSNLEQTSVLVQHWSGRWKRMSKWRKIVEAAR